MTLNRMSIGKRLSLLVVSELVTAAIVVITALVALARLSEQHRYMDSYVFAPLADIQNALVTADELAVGAGRPASASETRRLVGRLRTLIDRYQREWEVEGSRQPDAIRFRAMLERARRLSLLKDESEAADAARTAVRRMEQATGLDGGQAPAEPLAMSDDRASLTAALLQLNRVNLRYMEIGAEDYASRLRGLTMLYLVVGLASIVAAPLFGLAVRRAIVPRIAFLVAKIKRFRELGVHEPFGDWEGDELALLARALDMSFTAIATRDREREEFLAVAAHELKTPLATVKGFAQAALAHREDAALRDRALAVIDRQATRLGRLIQDLLWSASAHCGQLSFQPAPLDLEACTQRMIAEVELLADGRAFPLEVHGDAHILGDAWLIEQTLSSMLIQAATMAPKSTAVPVTLEATPSSVRVTVEAREAGLLLDDLDKLLEPFGVLQFEGRSRDAIRSTGLGLHLAREIARLHTGALRIERGGGGKSVLFVLELRR